MRKSIKELKDRIFYMLGFNFLVFCVFNTIKPTAVNNKVAWLLVILGVLIPTEVFFVGKVSNSIWRVSALASILAFVTATVLLISFNGIKRLWFTVIILSVGGILGFIISIVEWKIRSRHIERINQKLSELNGADNE